MLKVILRVLRVHLALLVSKRTRESLLTVLFTYSKIGSPRHLFSECSIHAELLEALPNLSNIIVNWKTHRVICTDDLYEKVILELTAKNQCDV